MSQATFPHLPSGVHIIAEFSHCAAPTLGDASAIARALERAAALAQAQVLDLSLHPFPGGGVSGVVVVAESHISIHTWPELGYVACDFYTCGPHTRPRAACEYLGRFFAAGQTSILEIERGLADGSGGYLWKMGKERGARIVGGLAEE